MTTRDVLDEAIARALHPSTYDHRAAAWDEAVAVFTDTDLLETVFPVDQCDFDHADEVLGLALARLRTDTGSTP